MTTYGITPLTFTKEEPPIVHNSPYLSPGFKRIGIFGQTGSGKTYLEKFLIPMLADVDGYFIVYCGTLKNQSKYDDLAEHMRNKGIQAITVDSAPNWDKLINTLHFFNSKGEEVQPEFDEDGNQLPWQPEYDEAGVLVLETPIAKTQGELMKACKHNLIVIDDQTYKYLHSDKILPWFTTSRHYHMSVILIHQRFVDVNKTARENMSLVVLYKTLDGLKSYAIQLADSLTRQKNLRM